MALASLVGTPFSGASGILTVTAYAGGVANYQYELRITSYNVCYTKLLREWSDWVVHSGLLSDERLRLFRCINQLLQFRLDPERHAEQFDYLLQQIYGQPLLDRVRLMLAGEKVFEDAPVIVV